MTATEFIGLDGEEEVVVARHSILVDRLYKLYDPFFALDLDEDFDYRSTKPMVEYYEGLDRDLVDNYDSRRIHYFMQRIDAGKSIQPIMIDNECDRYGILPQPVVVDGHHRFCAAILCDVIRIEVSYGGRIDVLNFLTGKTESCPYQ